METVRPCVDSGLEGTVAIVTGGNGGIGHALAVALGQSGAKVIVTGRDRTKNASVARELAGRGEVVSLDVRDGKAVAALVADVAGRYGRLDLIVNNAGIGGRAPLLSMDEAAWHEMLDTHLTGAFLLSRHGAEAMIEAGNGGSIVNIGSMYSLFGPPAGVHYAAAKTGLIGLTRALAVELAPHRIRVNAVLPGWIATEMTRTVRETDLGSDVLSKIPLARYGEPEDLAGVVLMLASSAGAYITGAAIPVDGGYHVADRPRQGTEAR